MDKERRQLNYTIHGIDDSVYMRSFYKDTLHCKLPDKYAKIGAINPDFEVSKRLVKVTYTTISEKDTMSVSNLGLMKETTHK